MEQNIFKEYVKKVSLLFIASLVLVKFLFFFHDSSFYTGIIISTLIWIVLTILLLLVNHKYLKLLGNNKLNIASWVLSVLILLIFILMFLDKGFDFTCIPSFAYIVSFLAIIKNFIIKNK